MSACSGRHAIRIPLHNFSTDLADEKPVHNFNNVDHAIFVAAENLARIFGSSISIAPRYSKILYDSTFSTSFHMK